MYPSCPVSNTRMRLMWPRYSLSFPDLPGCIPAGPQPFQTDFVAHGVHALPEAVVLVGHELPVARQALQGLALELRIVALDVVEHSRLEHEEGAVDPRLAGEGLLVEARHPLAIELQAPESCGRAHRGHGGDATV